MTGSHLVVLGIASGALLLALVLAIAGQALGDVQRARARRRPASPRPAARRGRLAVRSSVVDRLVPGRARLKPYSPEVLALVLVALAAGLWLSRLLG